jgi:hypothetical protein
MTCAFECFQSHCHILKKKHELVYGGCLDYFWKRWLHIKFGGLWIGDKNIQGWVHMRSGGR